MGTSAQPAAARIPLRVVIALGMVGRSAVVRQIVLMREFLVATSGNELALGIMLGLWLILTAGGSHFLGRLLSRISPHKLFPLLLIAEALALFAALFALRVSRVYWHASPGEVLGPLPVFVIAF